MRKIRVLVVEDSVVMRRAIMVALAKDPALDVTASARNGAEALEMIPTVNPDVITLDIEMPVKDGLATLRELRRVRTDLPVIMFSSHTQRGAQATLLALTLGATDCVGKPANMASVADSWKCLEEELLPKVKLHGEHSIQRGERTVRVAAPPAPLVNGVPGRSRLVSAICVGVSAGGPNALVRIFSQLTDPLPVPVLLVQHMPAMFTRMLAERLTSVSQMQFHEAEEGMPVEAGRGYLAPGGKHMTVAQADGQARVHLNGDAPENSCRPAADMLFRSAAATYGPRLLAVVLTGMGKDGLRGCETVRELGGRIVVQDEATSVVWGMPRAVFEAGLADAVLPLEQFPGELVRLTRVGR